MPFYAVRLGRKPGVYNSWPECHEQVVNFKNANYRKFDTKKEALLFICGFDNPGGTCTTPTKAAPSPTKTGPTSNRSAPYKSATPTSSSATLSLSSRSKATCTETSPKHSIDYQLKLTDEEISLLKEKLTFLQSKKQLLLTEKAFDERKLRLAKEESHLKLKEHQLTEKKKAPAANQEQKMLDSAEKCRKLLSGLLKSAATSPEARGRSIHLIQGLIDNDLQPKLFTELFTEQLQIKSPRQPYIVLFLKKTLPSLRQSLLSNEISIDGVRPPPPEVVQQQMISSSQPTSSQHTQ